jgi:hypothetical protein
MIIVSSVLVIIRGKWAECDILLGEEAESQLYCSEISSSINKRMILIKIMKSKMFKNK